MRALDLASLFSPQPLQWLPISLEKKAEAGGHPHTSEPLLLTDLLWPLASHWSHGLPTIP